MDPNGQRSRSPSLLDIDVSNDAATAPPDRILSGLQRGSSQPSATGSARRKIGLWALVALSGCVALLLLTVGGAFDGDTSDRSPAVVQGDPVAVAPASNAVDIRGPVAVDQGHSDPADASLGAAVILPDPFDLVGAPTAVPASASSAGDRGVMIGEIFAQPSASKPPTAPRRPARRATTTGDSDVTLLAALIRHVEVGDPASLKVLERFEHKPNLEKTIEARMEACPAANTVAGLRCRQKLCAANSGEIAACPASSTEVP